MTAIVDNEGVKRAVFASRDYKVKSRAVAERYITNYLSSQKRELVRDFNENNITKEIESGESGQNISGTLSGRGNLFSFIGLHKGTRPTDDLRGLLMSINYLEPRYKNGLWVFEIPIPDNSSIISVTPMPWQPGAGWAIEVEKGISGLGHYLNVNSVRSRSGGGLQVKGIVGNSMNSSRRPYITPMLNDFRVKLGRFRI